MHIHLHIQSHISSEIKQHIETTDDPVGPTERVPNPGIAGVDGTPWSSADAVFVGSGVMTWTEPGIVMSPLDPVLDNGTPYDLTVDLTNINAIVTVRLFNTVELTSQVAYTGTPASGLVIVSGVTTSTRDDIRIQSTGVGAATLAVTNVSLIA